MADEAAPKKTSMLIALGGLKAKPGATDADDDMGDDDAAPPMGEVKSTAAADVMAAFKSDDATALEDALTRFVEACSSEGYSK